MSAPAGLVDLHSHLAPGIDDGARDLGEALAAIDRLVEAGVRTILTTPHLEASLTARPSLFESNQARIDEVWAVVTDACRGRHPDVTLLQGRELMLDVPEPVAEDPRIRLNGGPFVLVEYPRLRMPNEFDRPLRHLTQSGHRPILAHVERYAYDGPCEAALQAARAAGAPLQLNAASLVGRYGPRAEALGWSLLERGWIDVAASDYHGRGSPWVAEARSLLAERGGGLQSRLLFEVNPARVLAGERLEPVQPLAAPGRWRRLQRWWAGR